MRVRKVALAAATAALALGMTSTAWAHDCFIVNRSDQGDLAATHSSRWVAISVDEFAHSDDFPPGVDPDCFVAYWTSHGGPASFTTRSDKTIGEDSANPNLANGKGLDHIEDAYGPLFGAALQACAE
jgi:hypothetical protein